MQKNMQINAGVFRIEKTLKEGCRQIDEALDMFNKVGIKDRVIMKICFIFSHLYGILI